MRRLDPDRYDPVDGDDSTTVDDAPTLGKFFVRIEKGQGTDGTQAMWGSFHTSLTGTEFTAFNRALHGGRGRYVSEAATAFGERRGRVEGFAAEPGTLQSREEFRGTGDSLYWLRQQDISRGAERVWIEVRDKDTGLVPSTRQLVPVQDYETNAIQGRILLCEPLAGDLSRRALGLSLGYRQDQTRYAGALEFRHERGTARRVTRLTKNTLGHQVNPDWRFLGRLNFSVSDGGAGSPPDADCLELVRAGPGGRWTTTAGTPCSSTPTSTTCPRRARWTSPAPPWTTPRRATC